MKQVQLWLIVIAGVGVSSGEALAWECGQTHYHCEAGNSINWDEAETEWTWGCEDDLGNVDYCREEKPEREEDPQEDPALPSDPDPVDPADPADPSDPVDPIDDPADPSDPTDPADPADPVDPADPGMGMGGNNLEEDQGLVAASDDDPDDDDDDDKKKKKEAVIDPARSLPAVGLPTFWIASLILLFGLGLGLSAVFLRNTRVFTAWSKE